MFTQNNASIRKTSLSSQEIVFGSEQSNALQASSPVQKPEQIEKAQSLAAKPECLASKLCNLPNEMLCEIFSWMDQKSLENVFIGIEKIILLEISGELQGPSSIVLTSPLVQVLKAALISFSKPIYFNATIRKILLCAKRLNIKTVFEHSPSLEVDFSDKALKNFTYLDLKRLFKNTNCGFKAILLKGLKEETISFSTKTFKRLASLKIEQSGALKNFELDDEENTCSTLELIDCKELHKVDVYTAFQLVKFSCKDADKLQSLSIDSESRIEEFIFEGCSLEKIDLELLAQGLKKTCKKLNLSGSLTQTPATLVRFLGNLPNLNALNLSGISAITHLDFLQALYTLEDLNLEGCDQLQADSFAVLGRYTQLKRLTLPSNEQITNLEFLRLLVRLEELSLGNYDSFREGTWDVLGALYNLKVLDMSMNAGAGLSNLDFLRACPNLEVLDLGWSFPDISTQAFNVLADLKQLRKLNLQDTYIEDLSILASLELLQELNLSGCTNISDESFSVLRCLKQLRKLSLEDTKISNLAVLEPLELLQELNISYCSSLDGSQIEWFQSLRPGCQIIKENRVTQINYNEIESSESEGEDEPFWSDDED